MYLHLGQDTLVKTKDVIGIFDLDNTTVAKGTKRFLSAAEKGGRVVTVADDLPKTFVLCGKSRRDCKVYLSQISASTLKKRTKRGGGVAPAGPPCPAPGGPYPEKGDSGCLET